MTEANAKVSKANSDLTQANTDLDLERRRAEANETQAINAVQKFRDAVANNPELKNNLSLDKLRKTLMKEPLAFFKGLRDRLQADKDARPESLSRLAQASFDLGELTNEIGDKKDALSAYQESQAIYQKLADAYPTVTEYQRGLGCSQFNTTRPLLFIGEHAAALKAVESAEQIFQRLADANPTVSEFRKRVAHCHFRRAERTA